ncbi:DUF1499 domain-containing protein [Nitrospira sp. T9]|uniref:DUF1499 domain-containing protein n=1 Tax=unclassified Nitrospira TaxID=2652172 RepID=UPI003F9DB907
MTKTIIQKTVLMSLLFLAIFSHGATGGELGVQDHRLAPCPSSPNCVSTLSDSETHSIDPFRYNKTMAEAKGVLKQIIGEMSRSELVQEEEGYLHYEFRSLLFRFVDDVEILFDDGSKTIHFRSASRVGYSDFGVNRSRMEEVRKMVQGKL